MKRLLSSFVVLAFSATAAIAAPQIGAPAPDFTLPGSDGQDHTLSGYQGSTVVLEWTNHDCPFVKKHYESGNMQQLQQRYTDDGVIWLAVVSSAPGKQGHASAEEARAIHAEQGAASTAVLLDPTGEVGRQYGASTTPHMYVIDEEGILRYRGAIDDKPTADKADIDGAKNYVVAALEALAEGTAIETAVTTPYGCSVKY